MIKIYHEFKKFAIKGNVFDMAIGVIIGTAFGKIVSSIVKDIMMPLVGYLAGNTNFYKLKFVLQEEIKDTTGNITQELIAVNYGTLGQLVIDFLIIAVAIFVALKVINKLRDKAEDEKDTTVPTPKDIQLLSEIRDLLQGDDRDY